MSYVQPVPGAKRMRSDQGRDYQGTPGSHVVAIGRARIDAVKNDPNGFGVAIYYTLLDGPSKGTQIYVGHAQPNVRRGQIVKAGAPVATLLQNSLGNAAGMAGWTEVGIARGGQPLVRSGNTGGQLLDKLLTGASTTTDAAAVPSTTAAPADQGSAPSLVPPVATPPPTAIGLPGPTVNAPGGETYSLWKQVASGDFVSPDTRRFLANAQISGG